MTPQRTALPPAQAAPLDQAHGLRRLFGGRHRRVLALVANPHVAFSTLALDRLAAVLAAQGRQVLVVDAAAAAPAPHELAVLDLASGIEALSPQVGYLAARGLPLQHVDTRGSAAGFVDALHAAAPQAEVVLLHAEAPDLARMFRHGGLRPVLLGADHPHSVKHAYASCKLLAQRCGLLSFDLLLVASRQSPRVASIAQSLADCADTFAGAALVHSALVDPAASLTDAPDEALASLLDGQMRLDVSMPLPSSLGSSGAQAAMLDPRPRAAPDPRGYGPVLAEGHADIGAPRPPPWSAAAHPNRPVLR